MIAHHGRDKAREWLQGVKDNLAVKPSGGDRDQAKLIFAGECDVALGNHYYVALMMANEDEPEQKEWAEAIKVVLPNAAERGSHVNVSGMALAANAPHKDDALKLMQFLASDEAHASMPRTNTEYPLAPAYRFRSRSRPLAAEARPAADRRGRGAPKAASDWWTMSASTTARAPDSHSGLL
jgi:iron(III) transport system substrate-binding protein